MMSEEYEAPDELLFKKTLDQHYALVYPANGNLVSLLKDKSLYQEFNSNRYSYNIKFENATDHLTFKQTEETSFSVYADGVSYLFSVDDFVSSTEMEI